jgi:hypothetical protein
MTADPIMLELVEVARARRIGQLRAWNDLAIAVLEHLTDLVGADALA